MSTTTPDEGRDDLVREEQVEETREGTVREFDPDAVEPDANPDVDPDVDPENE